MHKEFTGVDNGLILENLFKLSKSGKEIWIRIPVIPDFNNTIEEMTDIASIIAGLPSVSRVTLMPYHTLGVSKYETLRMPYCFDVNKKISNHELNCFAKVFMDRGIVLA